MESQFSPWTLEEALNFIRPIEQQVFDLKYNIALTGGVLKNGRSNHDLDLMCIPANFSQEKESATLLNYTRFCLWIISHFKDIIESYEIGQWNAITTKLAIYTKDGRKIDWFIVYGADQRY